MLDARLWYCEQDHGAPPTSCNAHRMLVDWNYLTATWITFDFPAAYAATPECTTDYSSLSGGWLSWNITAAAQHVVDGNPNYGIVLVPAWGWDVNLHAVEAVTPSLRPYLEILYLEAPADTTAPGDPVVGEPADGATLSGVVTVSGTATDNMGVVTVTVQINGDTPVSATLDTPGGTSTGFTLDVDTGAYNGAGTITITVSDGTNTSSTVLNVTFDNPTGGKSKHKSGCMPGGGTSPVWLLIIMVLIGVAIRPRP